MIPGIKQARTSHIRNVRTDQRDPENVVRRKVRLRTALREDFTHGRFRVFQFDRCALTKIPMSIVECDTTWPLRGRRMNGLDDRLLHCLLPWRLVERQPVSSGAARISRRKNRTAFTGFLVIAIAVFGWKRSHVLHSQLGKAPRLTAARGVTWFAVFDPMLLGLRASKISIMAREFAKCYSASC